MWGEPRLFAVAIPSFLYCFCIFMLYPLMGLLFVDIACREHGTNLDDDCSSSHISSIASRILLYGSLASEIPTFFFVGFYSSLSDRLGRRMAMMLPAFGSFIYFGGIFFIIVFKPESYMYIYLAVSLIHGSLGSYSTFLMASFSYISDISAPQDRPRLYSYLEAAVFIAQGSGPVIGGMWAVQSGFLAPFFAAVVVLIITFIWAYFMPESLPESAPTRLVPFSTDPFESIRNLISFFRVKTPAGISALPFSMATFGFAFLALSSNAVISPLYLKHRLHWDSDKYGIAASVQGIILVVGMLLMRPTVAYITGYEFHSAIWIFIGSSAWCAYYLIFSFLNSTTAVYLLLILCVFSGPLIPMIRSILANSVPSHMQSRVQATYGGIQVIMALFANVVVAIYSESVDVLPQLAYWTIAFICFCGAVSAGCPIFLESIRKNLPDMDGYLPPDFMGFPALEPLLIAASENDEDTKFKQIETLHPSATDTGSLLGNAYEDQTRRASPTLMRKKYRE